VRANAVVALAFLQDDADVEYWIRSSPITSQAERSEASIDVLEGLQESDVGRPTSERRRYYPGADGLPSGSVGSPSSHATSGRTARN